TCALPISTSPRHSFGGPSIFRIDPTSRLPYHDEGVDGLAVPAYLEVEVRGRGAAGGAAERNDLVPLDAVTGRHEQARRVPVHRLDAAAMVDQHELAVHFVGARGRDDARARGADVGIFRHRDVDPRVVGFARGHAARDVPGLTQRPRVRLRWLLRT